MSGTARFAHLPGGHLLETGLRDVRAGVRSVPALLVAMAWPRLEPLGLLDREGSDRVRVPGEDFEHTTYRALCDEVGREAHARLNSLRAEVESGICALERERRLSERAG